MISPAPRPGPDRMPKHRVSRVQDVRYHTHPDEALHPESCLRCKTLTDKYAPKENN